MCLFSHDAIVVEPATAVNEARTPLADTWIYPKSLVHATRFFGKTMEEGGGFDRYKRGDG
jgi:hypothetical protein